MKKAKILFGIISLVVTIAFPVLVFGSDWKVKRTWVNPGCYQEGKENSMRFFFEFQATSPSSPGDLIIRVIYQSNIENFEKKLNLTQAVNSTCGPHATTCPVNWDGETIVVGQSPGFYNVTKDGIIGPKVRGDVITTIEAYTHDSSGTRLTDTKRIIVKVCLPPIPKPPTKPLIPKK